MLLGFENEPRKLNTRILKELADFIPRGMVAIINRHDGNGTIPVGREEDVEAVAQWFAAVEEHGEVTQVAADKTITQKLGSI